MGYQPLPKTLTSGMKLAAPKYYQTPEIVEVFSVDEATGLLKLIRADGVILRGNYSREQLADFDYQLVCNDLQG